jgi:hypothetical protein
MARPIRKVLYTLNINKYAPEITALTFPLMKTFCKKIGAEFHVITEREYPEWPITYEKLQIFRLGRGRFAVADEHRTSVSNALANGRYEPPPDWNWFLDADTLISPEMFDPTDHLSKDTVCHNGKDMGGLRWRYDQYFRRDGRHIGSCNWCTIASDWCLDLWHPLEDLTLEQALANIHPTINERTCGFCEPEHLIDDYTLSRNIARYGLKTTTIMEIYQKLGIPIGLLWHKYTVSNEQKVQEMLAVLSTPNGRPAFPASEQELAEGQIGNDGQRPVLRTKDGTLISACGIGWGIMTQEEVAAYRKQWGV